MYCTGRSSNTKPLCNSNKTELNRNSKTEMRWNKKEVLCNLQNCGKSSDQGRKETGEYRSSWGRETPKQWVESSISLLLLLLLFFF